MLVRRKWFFTVVVGAAFVIFLYRRNDTRSRFILGSIIPGHKPQLHPPYIPPPKTNSEGFSWANSPVKYPVSSMIPLPSGSPKRLPKIQYKFGSESNADSKLRQERLAAIKKTFERCWKSYRARAWMKDELAPISGLYRNTFGGWAATLVDNLDTLWIMGMKETFREAATAAMAIDFSQCIDGEVNVFETNIRYLGGFLSAYDLSGEKALLDKAVEVGEMLYATFDTPNRMPLTRWSFQTGKIGKAQLASEAAIVAEIGSLSVEFTRLTQLTGEPKWFDAIQRIANTFDQQQNHTKLPGMWPVLINARAQDFAEGSDFTLGGMSDSLYEYFSKEYALLGGLSPMYEKLYRDSMATAIKTAFFRPKTPSNADILFSGDVRAESRLVHQLEPKGQHLTCFAGGMLALGGRLFSIPEHVSIGRKLVEGCIWAYKALPLGIMPEVFHLIPCPSGATSCLLDNATWHAEVKRLTYDDDPRDAEQIIRDERLPPGFSGIEDRRYILRPEAIESIFVLYRITGDPSLRDSAWEMYSAIEKYTATQFANAALDDITVVDGNPPMNDRMESFWTAETLKYLYLLFSAPDLVDLDEWILNTEAHPLRRPKGAPTMGDWLRLRSSK